MSRRNQRLYFYALLGSFGIGVAFLSDFALWHPMEIIGSLQFLPMEILGIGAVSGIGVLARGFAEGKESPSQETRERTERSPQPLPRLR